MKQEMCCVVKTKRVISMSQSGICTAFICSGLMSEVQAKGCDKYCTLIVGQQQKSAISYKKEVNKFSRTEKGTAE